MSNSTWTNNDGLPVRFGLAQGARGNRSAVTRTAGKRNELTLDFDLEGAARTLFTADLNNDGTNDGFNGLDTFIPSGAKIVNIDWAVTEALAGGTSVEIGTYAANGTAIDIDGIINWNVGLEVGDDLNATYTADSYVTAVTVGTYTAGKISLTITYITP